MTPDKYMQPLQDSTVTTDATAIDADIKKIIADELPQNNTPETLRFLLNTIDLTTLKTTDSPRSVADFAENINTFDAQYPMLPNVAAICVYPCFAPIVRAVLEVSDVNIACVSGAFPTAQSFIETKISETALAVQAGADEIDIVFPVGNYLDNDYEAVADEISEQKQAAKNARLKVILETGALKTPEDIRNASILSLYSGADFLKTSTGKEYPGATLQAAYVMCQCIKEYHKKTGTMVGFKASGGVSTTQDALAYYTIVKHILGDQWMTNKYFRIGASRLANNLLSDILGKETKHF